jgi:hypothetical protein
LGTQEWLKLRRRTVAAKKPQANRDPLEAQDRSIKARKTELFDAEEGPDGQETLMPFKTYVETVPPSPLSPTIKALLWTLAALVTLLFLGAVLAGRPKKRHRQSLLDITTPHAVVQATSSYSATARLL